MEKRIITISREFGSGGRFIGEETAKKLGIAYYDKNIINEIAEKSGLSPEYVRESAELSPKKGLFAYAFAGRDITGKSIEDMVYEAQRKVILELADRESCVIIGRNADYILKDTKDIDLLRAFIYAPDEVRIHNIMESHNLSEKDARILLLEKDKRYHKRHLALTGSNRGDRHNRDILMNSSYLGIEGTAEYLEELIRRKFGSEEE